MRVTRGAETCLGKIWEDGIYSARGHKVQNGVLEVSFGSMDPFTMDGVELGLQRVADSPGKDGEYRLSFTTRKIEKHQVTSPQETMGWIPVAEV
jgi:hypothetical protein